MFSIFLHNPACLLIWLALNLLGVVLQKTSIWPNAWNSYIPLVLLIMGVTFTPLLVPLSILPPNQPHPKVLLGVLGFIFSVLAWFTHTYPLQWFLNKINISQK